MTFVMKKARGPTYPFIPLSTALDRAKEFYIVQGHRSALQSAAVALWGYTPKSGVGPQTIAALRQYGLMNYKGRGSKRQVQLTDLALRIIGDQRERSPERGAAIRKAAFSPIVHMYMRLKWGPKLPADATVLCDLKHERAYTEDAAKDIIKVYRDTVSFAKIEDLDMGSLPQESGSRDDEEWEHGICGQEENEPPGGKARKVKLLEGERVVFTEETDPQQYVKLIATGEVDDILLDAISAYVGRQRERLSRTADQPKQAQVDRNEISGAK